MSIRKIELNKLIMLMHADDSLRIKKLREDIRSELKAKKSGGGHFHDPFWSDAKNHVNGVGDLLDATNQRITDNKSRKRLYPELAAGFLEWWNHKRRWTNEPSKSKLLKVKGSVEFSDLACEVKVSNLLALSIGESKNRIIYPYFSESPPLSPSAARLAFFAIERALPDHSRDELRVLDIIRAKSYSISDLDFDGSEEFLFRAKYLAILREWEELWEEYDAA